MEDCAGSCTLLSIDGLEDELIELHLLRVLGENDASLRPPETRFLAQAPEYRFAIHRRSDGLRVGRIHLRVTDVQDIIEVLGHAGYEVDEAHRCQGYATRAIRLIMSLAWRAGMERLWLLIEPDNIASRRAVEKAGFAYIDAVDTVPAARGLGVGPRVCRYSAIRNSEEPPIQPREI